MLYPRLSNSVVLAPHTPTQADPLVHTPPPPPVQYRRSAETLPHVACNTMLCWKMGRIPAKTSEEKIIVETQMAL